MKKIIVLILIVIFNFTSVLGANEGIARAYKRKNYKKVCELSKNQDIRSLDFRLKLMLADSYFYTKEASLALSVYSVVLETKDISYFNTTRVLNYFELLQMKKKYSKIIEIYPFLSVKNQNNVKIISIYKSSLFLVKNKKVKNKSYKLQDNKALDNINVEYGIGFLGNSIICYSSDRRNIYNGLLKEKSGGLLSEYAEISENRYTLSCELFDFNLGKQDDEFNEDYSRINSNANNNFVSYINYSSEDNQAYFTDFSRAAHTQIFIQREKQNGNDEYVKCSFCNSAFDYAMPCVSNDGNTIYYISNDISGHGGWDLYKSEKVEDGKWGKPINLGNKVNSALDEMYPFIDNNDILYFSSNGHNGFGGFDIYKCDLKQDSLKIANLLKPVNSEANDFSFILSNSRNRAFCLRQINDVQDVQEMIRSFVYTPDTICKKKEVLRKDTLKINESINSLQVLVAVNHPRQTQKLEFNRVPVLPVSQKLSTSTNISFKFNKYDVQNISKDIIKKFFDGIEDISNYDVILSGYADFKGKEDYNLWLSHKRIESVADFLVEKCGIVDRQIFQVAYGEYDKYVENSKKRKVVIELVGKNELRNRVLVVYKLQDNLTVKDISKKFYCTDGDIRLINSISDVNQKIPKESLIMIPIKGIYRVDKNNTLYSISRSYKTSVSKISNINKIGKNSNISVKDILIIN